MAESEAAPGLTVGTTVGNYRIEQKIGEGGMGAVYLAEHPLLGRKAAVKVLLNEHSKRPDVVTRFFNEAKTTASLRHPALVEVFDFGFLPDGAGYIVMEYLDGESLASRLARVAPLAPELAAEIGRQLAAGVCAAHEQGIVHRDLKPDNIFLVPDREQPGRERVKILDFGIAKLMLPASVGSKGATTTGMLLGTPLYMAPEQCRGSGQVDHRADIYSVGCILYLMLTGRPPFDYEGVGEILAAHLHEPVTTPRSVDPTIPEQLELIVLRALAKKPDERYQNISDLGADLQRFVLGPTGPARPAPAMGGTVGTPVGSTVMGLGAGTGPGVVAGRTGGGAGARTGGGSGAGARTGDGSGGGGGAGRSASTSASASAKLPGGAAGEAGEDSQEITVRDPKEAPVMRAPVRLPPPAPLGGGRAAGMVVALLLVAGAAGGLLWWRIKGGDEAARGGGTQARGEPEGLPSTGVPTTGAGGTPGTGSPSTSSEAAPGGATGESALPGAAAEGPGAQEQEPATEPEPREPTTTAGTDPASEGGGAPAAGEPSPAGAGGAKGTSASASPGRRHAGPARPAKVSAGDRLFARAMDYRSRGEEAEALLAFRAALKADGLEGEDRAEAQRQQLLLRRKFGEVEIESAVDGVRVSVDGRVQGVTPLPGPLLLRPGKHELTLSHPRYRTVTRSIKIAATEKLPVRFEY